MSYALNLSEPTFKTPEHSIQKNYSLSSKTLRSSPSRSRKKISTSRSTNNAENYPIIVHSHLCWNWVWQRPQQFISRLSQRHKILFVETLAPDSGLATPVARIRTEENFPNITILTLQFPAGMWGDGDYVDRERHRLVQEVLAGPLAGQFEDPVQWFYDPMAVPAFLGKMNERLNVYDCMDELSRFRCAPPEIVNREALLLAAADVVFTGGYKLFESKSRFNDNCHFYGCGVDNKHFGRARDSRTKAAAALAALPRPVLG